MSYDFQTSYPAYKERDRQVNRQKVFAIIRQYGPCTDKFISDKLGWAINRITNRRGELVENGLVECAYKAPDKDSGRTVNYWQEKRVVFTSVTQANLFQ